MDHPPVGGARGILDWVGFPIYVARRFGRDACPSVAGSLSFTALLALVPVLVIGLAMFSAFPAFGDVRTAIVGTLFSTFLPSMSDAIYDQISTFMDNAGRTTGFGIIGLALTAILLILFGLSLSLSSHLFRAAQDVNGYGASEAVAFGVRAAPYFLQAAGFTLVYWLLPTRPVRLRDAAIGGLLAALLFEGLKQGFGVYLRLVPTYEVIYGALASVPVFLFWMYLVWCIALLGAEVAAALPEWRSGRRAVGRGESREDALRLALSVILLMGRERSRGRGLRVHKFVDKLPVDAVRVEELLEPLRRAHFMARDDTGRWIVSRDLRTCSIRDLAVALNLAMDQPHETEGIASRFPLVDEVIDDLRIAEERALSLSLQDLVDRHSKGKKGVVDTEERG